MEQYNGEILIIIWWIRIQYDHPTDAMLFKTNGNNEKVRITSGGNVGIGSTSPDENLCIYDSGFSGIKIHSGRTADNQNIGGLLFYNHVGVSTAYIYGKTGGRLVFGTAGIERLRITSAGDVGIGEDSPDCRFHIKDTINTAYTATNAVNSANNLVKVENTSTTANAFAGMQFRVGSGADLYFGAIQQNTNAGDFYFANQDNPDVELMRIKSTGKLWYWN